MNENLSDSIIYIGFGEMLFNEFYSILEVLGEIVGLVVDCWDEFVVGDLVAAVV